MRSVRSVDANDGVEVDQAAPLVFGDLGVRQPSVVLELGDLQAGRASELAAQGDREAVPQLARMGLPEHRAGVVVGTGVDGTTDAGIVAVVPLSAARAGPDLAGRGDRAVVNRTE